MHPLACRIADGPWLSSVSFEFMQRLAISACRPEASCKDSMPQAMDKTVAETLHFLHVASSKCPASRVHRRSKVVYIMKNNDSSSNSNNNNSNNNNTNNSNSNNNNSNNNYTSNNNNSNYHTKFLNGGFDDAGLAA